MVLLVTFSNLFVVSVLAWGDISLPKREGGLGLCSLEIFNLTLMTTHIWNIFFTPRDIAREGYSLQTHVADLMTNGTWNWPHVWLTKALNLGLIAPPILVNTRQDCVRWRDSNGNMVELSVKLAWEALRPCSAEEWSYVRNLAEMDAIQPNIHDIVAHLHPMTNKRTTNSIVGKLVLAASSYFIWNERNNRLFKNII
ncbi:hypothetical protein Tco_1114197 [Tanacetum coccineum]|uniref:Reverse transcriptase zinc-binding domain-containing protein n=1 Tax=Tanacetum coccineum TaxID=301880 RepID=A0ABQ5IUM2_9ASTR